MKRQLERRGINCQWLHEQIKKLPLINFPFNPKELPYCGIYFFYEEGEFWGHGGRKPRIVRIGSCRDGNFQSRISEHYLLDERKMNFDSHQSAPKDRSIFRQHLGRALLAKQKSNYSVMWKKNFTTPKERMSFGHLRDINLEKSLERQITKKIRETLSFRFIEINNQMGGSGLESRSIATVAQCGECKASPEWLGLFSPIERIRTSGLWNVHYTDHAPITTNDMVRLKDIVHNEKSKD